MTEPNHERESFQSLFLGVLAMLFVLLRKVFFWEVGQIPLGSVAVTLSVKIGGKLSFDVNFKNNIFTLKLGGEAYAKAGVVFGLKNVLEFDFGVKGTLISCDFTTKIKKSGSSYSKSSINIKASAGKVSVYATGKVAKVFTLFNESYEIWKGWSLVNITW